MRRWRTPRLIAVATAGLLAFGGVDVAAAGAADEQAAATEDAALALARQSGAPVVIESMAGERQLFVANPDGTIRAELTTAPARALVAGTWQDIDLTLDRKSVV